MPGMAIAFWQRHQAGEESKPAQDNLRVVVFNRATFCGSCREWFTTTDGTKPHDVEACYLKLYGELPPPNPIVSAS